MVRRQAATLLEVGSIPTGVLLMNLTSKFNDAVPAATARAD